MAYDVYNYATGDVLEGRASKGLVRESLAEHSGTGAVAATLRDGVWLYVADSEVEARERQGDEVITVYVMEARAETRRGVTTAHAPAIDHPSYKIGAGTRPACGRAVTDDVTGPACVLPVGHDGDCADTHDDE
jgi:hypothetical protein